MKSVILRHVYVDASKFIDIRVYSRPHAKFDRECYRPIQG